MSRWAPDAALRLESAALELFAEQGYAATTVPQITARAGLTTRTFFRHFTDKREVLFLRDREFPAVVAALVAAAPPSLTPMDLVMHGLETVTGENFDGWRDGMILRRAVIRSDEHLRERELLKSSRLAEAIEHALIADGVDASEAALVAPFGVMLFDAALTDWLDAGDGRRLPDVLRATRTRLRALID
ncbi:helix-turn-helix domain-containing protein [Cryobacterium sp. AP23]